MQFLTSKRFRSEYIPGVKGFAESFPQIGPYKKDAGIVAKKILPNPPKINPLRLNSPKSHIRYNEELKQLKYQYLKETFDANQKDQKIKKTENVDGLIGPRRLRKKILLKYPDEQMTVVKRNALAIDELFSERLALLIKQRDVLIYEFMTKNANGQPELTREHTLKIKKFLVAQIGTAPDVIKTHLNKTIDLDHLLFNGLISPNWDDIVGKQIPIIKPEPEMDKSRLEMLLKLFHASESFVTESNLSKVVDNFVSQVDLDLKSKIYSLEQNESKSLQELMRAIIENGIIPEHVDNQTGGVDSPSFKSRSTVVNDRALNLFQEESLQGNQNMARPTAYTPDTADLTINEEQDLLELNVSTSAPPVPLKRQRMPRGGKYALDEIEVANRRLTDIGEDGVPSYAMSKEDSGFVQLPKGDAKLLKKEREMALLEAYKGTVNSKFGVDEVLKAMEKENK